jgi:protein ImuA
MFWTAASPAIARPKVGSAVLHDLRDRIARIGRAGTLPAADKVLPLGIPAIDRMLPNGGLALGALHEAAGAGPDTEHAATATLFVAGLAARMQGAVLWVMQRADLFAPGLAGAGLPTDRVIFVEAGKSVLPVLEEGLRHPGLAVAVGEVSGRLTLVSSRRLQLAAEQTGILTILLRRSRCFDDPSLREPTAAVTRWQVTALASPPPLPHAPRTPGIGPAHWRLDLLRCRGGEPGQWIVSGCDASGRLALVEDVVAPSVWRHSA